jgi:hypothetical protein
MEDPMGFIRRQEEKLAARLILWHQERNGLPPLSAEALTQKSAVLVDEAHRVGRRRGQNLAAIMKEMVADILKR